MTVFCWCDDGFDEREGGGSGFRPAEFKASGESGAEKRCASRFFLAFTVFTVMFSNNFQSSVA